MENMVKNAYTAHRIDNSTGYGNYITISNAAFQDNTFAFDLWLYIEDGGSEILSQTNGFSLGVSQNKVIIRFPGKATLAIESRITGIPEREWINLYVGYDGKKIIAFVNGNSIGETGCTGKLLNESGLIVGREFTGYIRSLRLYNRTMTEEEFRKYYMAAEYQALTMQELCAFLDFTQMQIPDLSGRGVTAQIYGSCAYMDLVDVYCPQIGEFTHFAEPGSINPGGFDTGQFSIYLKQYIRPSGDGRQILYINGELNEEDAIALFSEKKDQKTDFVFRVGKKEYCFKSGIPDYTWVDVLVCVNESRITSYINATENQAALDTAFYRGREGNLKIGGCQNASDMLCQNYIHTVAVFDRELSGNDAADFMENHPFVLEDGLVALVSFEGGKALELVEGIGITAGEKGLFPAQRTVSEIPADPYEFRVNYTREAASEMKKWEAEQIVAGYKDFGTHMSGCGFFASGALVEALIRYLSNHEKLLQKAASLYAKPVIESSDAAAAIGRTDLGFLKTLFKVLQLSAGGSVAAASVAAVGETAMTVTAYKYEAIFAIGCVAAVTAASAIAVAVNELHKDKPDYDDDDKDDISVKILSITFQHDPDNHAASAVRCRNYKGPVSGPEWTHEKKCVVPALYIADQVRKIKIKFKYKIIDNSGKKASQYTVSFSANVSAGEGKLFDKFSYKADGLSEGVEYEAEMESGITASVEKQLQFTQITLWWNSTVNGKNVMLPDTKSDIYIIPSVPASPVFIEKGCEKYLPAVEYLKILTQMLKKDAVPFAKEDHIVSVAETVGSTKDHFSGRTETVGNTGDYLSERTEIVGITEDILSEGTDMVRITQDQLRQLTQMIFYAPCFKYCGMGNPEYVSFRYYEQTGLLEITFHQQKFFEDIDRFNHGDEPLWIECEIYAAILGYYLRLLNVDFRPVIILNPHQNGNQRLDLHTNMLYTAGNLDEQPEENLFLYHVVIEVAARNEQGANIPAQIYDASMGRMQDGYVRPFTGLEFNRVNGPDCDANQEAGTYRAIVFKDGSGAMISNTDFAFNVV